MRGTRIAVRTARRRGALAAAVALLAVCAPLAGCAGSGAGARPSRMAEQGPLSTVVSGVGGAGGRAGRSAPQPPASTAAPPAAGSGAEDARRDPGGRLAGRPRHRQGPRRVHVRRHPVPQGPAHRLDGRRARLARAQRAARLERRPPRRRSAVPDRRVHPHRRGRPAAAARAPRCRTTTRRSASSATGTGFDGESLAGAFDYVIAIDYNRKRGMSPRDWTRPMGESRGGGIWLHVDHGGPTEGCVSLPAAGDEDAAAHPDPGPAPGRGDGRRGRPGPLTVLRQRCGAASRGGCRPDGSDRAPPSARDRVRVAAEARHVRRQVLVGDLREEHRRDREGRARRDRGQGAGLVRGDPARRRPRAA